MPKPTITHRALLARLHALPPEAIAHEGAARCAYNLLLREQGYRGVQVGTITWACDDGADGYLSGRLHHTVRNDIARIDEAAEAKYGLVSGPKPLTAAEVLAAIGAAVPA